MRRSLKAPDAEGACPRAPRIARIRSLKAPDGEGSRPRAPRIADREDAIPPDQGTAQRLVRYRA
jgi:hypothetical protein